MERDLRIPIDGIELAGTLGFPMHAVGFVIFVHGSGENRHCARDREVAQILQAYRIATLRVDLQTADEQRIDDLETTLRPDVDVLAERLLAITDRVTATGETRGLPIGYCGEGTGAAAALIAAARARARIAAIVCGGGRPELATPILEHVTVPTLLIAGDQDPACLAGHRLAASMLGAPHALEIIPGATGRFEELGARAQVARLAARWFRERFAAHASPYAAAPAPR